MKMLCLVSLLLFGLSCTGMGGGACCTVEDILAMQRDGVSAGVMVDAIRTSGTDLNLTAADLTQLEGAGVERTVIDVLNGGPCVCSDGPAPAVVDERTPRALRLRVVHKGGKSLEVVNLSSTTYTGVTVVLNGEWQYQLKRLPAGKTDSMRFGSFRSTRSGEPLRKLRLKTVTVRARQGSYSQSF